MKETTLQHRVNRSLDAAVFENEYVDLMTRTPEEVAVDMVTYDPSLEDEEDAEVAPCVKDYQAWYASSGGIHPRIND